MELFIISCLLVWMWALVSVCSRRDIDIHDKVSWVVTILVLNALGAMIYLVACPKQEPTSASTCGTHPDTIPESPEGRAWLALRLPRKKKRDNPFALSYNRGHESKNQHQRETLRP